MKMWLTGEIDFFEGPAQELAQTGADTETGFALAARIKCRVVEGVWSEGSVSHGHDAVGDIGAADVVQIMEPIPRGHGSQLMQNRLVGLLATEMLLRTKTPR
jgi:hypothetical protein